MERSDTRDDKDEEVYDVTSDVEEEKEEEEPNCCGLIDDEAEEVDGEIDWETAAEEELDVEWYEELLDVFGNDLEN